MATLFRFHGKNCREENICDLGESECENLLST